MNTEEYDPLKQDFRNFALHAFKVMGIEPDPIQYAVMSWLQHAPPRRILSCMRGFGKTVIVAVYCAWRFYCNPNRLILVQSGGSERAKEIVALIKMILRDFQVTSHLIPQPNDTSVLNQAHKFNILIRTRKAKDPSLAAYGHRSMVTGCHIDDIIADDLQTPENSLTDQARLALLQKVAEYEDLLIPEYGPTVTMVGTPQTQQSIYFSMLDIGYEMIRVPAEYPSKEQPGFENLAPFLVEKLESGQAQPGDPTYPERMDAEYLKNKKDMTPPARYRLQMLLDPSLSDADRYPLKLRDLIVFDSDLEMMPSRLIWTNDQNFRMMIPCAGLRGDGYYSPRKVSDEFSPYSQTVMYIDPAGKGKDQTAVAIAMSAPGYIYVPHVGGYQDTFGQDTMKSIALLCLKYKVNRIYVESNFGGGAWAEVLKPWLSRYNVPAMVTDDHVRTNKEQRIVDTLRPVMGTHKLVVSSDVARDAVLGQQIAYVTYQRGSLTHDDRVDALAGAVSKVVNTLGADFVQNQLDLKQGRLKRMVQGFYSKQPEPHTNLLTRTLNSGGLRRF